MRIYFSGIGGVGIGPLAEIAFDAGYEVMGSDREAGLMTDKLFERTIPVSFDQSGDFLRDQHAKKPFDWLVYTAALPETHPELMLAHQLGIKTAKRDELLAHIINEKNLKLIAIAGTHGKTTTTGLMTWALKELGVPVSYSIGTTLSWGPSGLFDPESEYFVYECDEFDRNFLHFSPWLSIITSIEHDHPDTYPTEAEYMAAFRQFIHQSAKTVLWQIDANTVKTRESSAMCLQEDQVLSLPLAGEHNRRNGTLVFTALEQMGIGENQAIRDTIQSFPGTERRFERLADNLYSDYGHTPTEIVATLQLTRELSDHVVLVYQPHQNIRQHDIISRYQDELFANADTIYWLPTYLSRENTSELPLLTPQELTTQLDPNKLHLAEFDDDLWNAITTARQNGSLVLCMGAGTIDGWVRGRLYSTPAFDTK